MGDDFAALIARAAPPAKPGERLQTGLVDDHPTRGEHAFYGKGGDCHAAARSSGVFVLSKHRFGGTLGPR
jgi:hypothetical protein